MFTEIESALRAGLPSSARIAHGKKVSPEEREEKDEGPRPGHVQDRFS